MEILFACKQIIVLEGKYTRNLFISAMSYTNVTGFAKTLHICTQWQGTVFTANW